MEDLRELLKLSEDPLGRAVPIGRELVARIDAAVETVVEKGEGGGYLSLLNPMVQGRDAGEAVLYAAGYLQARAGDNTVARQLFTHLVERLEPRQEYEALGAVLSRALSLVGTPEFARAAARLWEKGGSESAPPELLRRAFELDAADHRVLWAVGASRLADGDAEGLRVLARSLPGYAKKHNTDRLEEGALTILENPSREALRPVLEALELLSLDGETESAVALFELTQPAVIETGLARESWDILRKILEKSEDREAYRKAAATVGVAAHDDVREPAKLFETAGVGNPDVPVAEALATLDKLLEMPPGRHVIHHGWGVGEILGNDGQNLTIRFEGKDEHRMSVSLAKTALRLLDPTDLRVKVYLDRDGMMQALKTNRAEFLYHALVHLGGRATQDDVKKMLVTLGILTPTSWADWWKNARKEAENDARFDFSQIFRKVIRIQGENGSASALPEVDLAGNHRKSLDLLFRFLDQHPEEAERVLRRYGDGLRAIAGDEDRNPADRVQVHVLLHRVGGYDDETFRKSLDAFLRVPDLTPLGTEQQKTLLAMSPDEKNGAVAAVLLDSKVQGVRREAWTALSARDEKERAREIESILTGSPARSSAVIHVVRELVAVECPDVFVCLHALINIVEHPEKENYRKSALETLRTDEFRRCLAAASPTPEDGGYLRNRLLNWKHSERYLFPILETLQGTAFASIAEEAESQRQAMRPKRGGKGVLDQYAGRVLMTRATLGRLRKEAETLDWDLKTTIPQEIRKAREHGDLRENAEYDAAKLKQADATKRLGELNERMRLVKLIDEIEIPDGVIGPGMEVGLLGDDGGEKTYWILGEGDGDLADHVVSYRAPLGQMLLGKKVGDEAGPINERTYRVTAIRRRLPETTA